MSVDNARKALREYIEQVVMCGDNADGEPLREALFASRDAEARAQLRVRLLREAELWGPGAPEWSAIPSGRAGHTIYSGRLLQLYTEVHADSSGEVYDTVVSLD